MKRGVEIRSEDVRPGLRLHSEKQIILGHSGIVDEDVDRLLLQERFDPLTNIARGDVELHARCAVTGAGDLGCNLLDALHASGSAKNVSATIGETPRDRFADSTRGAGDER